LAADVDNPVSEETRVRRGKAVSRRRLRLLVGVIVAVVVVVIGLPVFSTVQPDYYGRHADRLPLLQGEQKAPVRDMEALRPARRLRLLIGVVVPEVGLRDGLLAQAQPAEPSRHRLYLQH
jgi:hypothetical protein